MSDYNISLRPHHLDNDLAHLNSCAKNLLNISVRLPSFVPLGFLMFVPNSPHFLCADITFVCTTKDIGRTKQLREEHM